MPRADLLELTPEALTALANAGFVKRAQKDLAAGLLPHITEDDDGTVNAVFDDGVRTHLAPGHTLRDAACDCPASGMCRHRVMLVLAYQTHAAAAPPTHNATAADTPASQPQELAAAWSPAQFDDAALAASVAPLVLEQARRLAAARPVVAVQAWRSASEPPSARLPMCSVRFFSRHSLVHARCDCQQGSGCAHVVLAVWAFRAAGPLSSDTETTVEVVPRGANHEGHSDGNAPAPADNSLHSQAAQTACAHIQALLLALWLDGSSQPLLALTARMEAARAQVQALGWCWVDDALDECWQLLQAQHARSSRFDAQRLLAVVAELWARLQAAQHAQTQAQQGHKPMRPASQILGLGIKGSVALDHLRLVSLGAVLWSDAQAEGASVLLADPDTQTVTVLERRWERAANATAGGPATALSGRRVAGLPLRQLASGQIITKTATRRANGLIDISPGARQTSVFPLSPTAWDELLPPLRQPTVPALVAHLNHTLPTYVLPRQAATGAATGAGGALHVLDTHNMHLRNSHWDAVTQTLHAQLVYTTPPPDTEPEHPTPPDTAQCLWMALPHRAATPGAVDALARALAGEWGALRAIAGTVQLQAGRAVMQPLALLTTTHAVVLQVQAPAPQTLPLPTTHPAQKPQAHAIRETETLLTQWLRQGLRHQGFDMQAHAKTQAERLHQTGLTHCASLLQTVHQTLRSPQQAALVAQLATLSLLLQAVAQRESV